MNRFKIYLILTSCFLLLTSTFLVHAQEAFVGPGGCTSKEECRTYCDVDSNKEECLNFALEKGLMSREEIERAKKFLKQTGPGGCRGEACRTYCEEPAHTEECIKFAEDNGIIRSGEAERMRKFRKIEQEGGPGGCKGEACREYCEDESHMEECFAFAKENGLVGEEEIKGFETSKKIRSKINETGGPGGCRSERECHVYCSDESHMEECAAFGAQVTGQSPEEMKRMLREFKEGGMQDRRGRGPEAPEEFRKRFEDYGEQFRGHEREGEFERSSQGMPVERGQFRGPGGCDSGASCREYCMNNPEACGVRMRPPEGEYMAPPEGMMRRPESERMPYDSFRPESQMMPPEGMMIPPPGDTMMRPPEPPPQPTSYNYSRSFIANVWSAFLAPFRD